MKDTKEYQREITKHISLSGTGGFSLFEGSFTGSSSYKKAEQTMNNGMRGLAEATA